MCKHECMSLDMLCVAMCRAGKTETSQEQSRRRLLSLLHVPETRIEKEETVIVVTMILSHTQNKCPNIGWAPILSHT